MSRYANKRMMFRSGGGKFRKVTAAEFGIGGICPKCNLFLLHHYDGAPDDPNPDPRMFRYRCFTCEPLTPTPPNGEPVSVGQPSGEVVRGASEPVQDVRP